MHKRVEFITATLNLCFPVFIVGEPHFYCNEPTKYNFISNDHIDNSTLKIENSSNNYVISKYMHVLINKSMEIIQKCNYEWYLPEVLKVCENTVIKDAKILDFMYNTTYVQENTKKMHEFMHISVTSQHIANKLIILYKQQYDNYDEFIEKYQKHCYLVKHDLISIQYNLLKLKNNQNTANNCNTPLFLTNSLENLIQIVENTKNKHFFDNFEFFEVFNLSINENKNNMEFNEFLYRTSNIKKEQCEQEETTVKFVCSLLFSETVDFFNQIFLIANLTDKFYHYDFDCTSSDLFRKFTFLANLFRFYNDLQRWPLKNHKWTCQLDIYFHVLQVQLVFEREYREFMKIYRDQYILIYKQLIFNDINIDSRYAIERFLITTAVLDAIHCFMTMLCSYQNAHNTITVYELDFESIHSTDPTNKNNFCDFSSGDNLNFITVNETSIAYVYQKLSKVLLNIAQLPINIKN